MTAIEELEAAKADAASVRADLDKAKAASAAELDAANKLLADASANATALVAERDGLAAKVKALETAASAQSAELDKARADLAEANGKLRNPAFAAAAIAETDHAAAGAEAAGKMDRATTLRRYDSMPRATQEDAQALARFRAEHWQELGLKRPKTA